ncbi:CaiB/BaiF CoA transferase family protein [Minwuia thermotolerans]|uniref:Formyl-CoA transferase n=1 Tax=Minwuia thermotolerans TaxID=2056226 RepID=A0A2M9G416_9PROT|nr:CoA transferase [Minwuia thermotolerans]PJK30438.1 formyl-CoA transferase [Minwuia thermotolerans]
MSGPLEGIRVLDLTRFAAGPHATQMMGDSGADVVKVEGLTGDGMRMADSKVGKPDSMFFMTINRAKRSLSVDLRNEDGKAVLRDLVARADILVENFRPGVMEDMGFGWETLQEINPRLILVRVSGFGQDGPWAKRASYDPVIQALSGFQELTGPPDGPPTVCGTVVTDYLTGLHAVIGAVTALQGRERTGRGQWVDVSMLDAATSLLMTAIPEYLHLGQVRTRRGNKNPVSVPSHCFECADGRFVHITAWTDGEFAKLSKAMGMPELLEDPRFADIDSRVANEKAIEKIIADWMMQFDAAEVERRLMAMSLPAARVATIAEVAENPQLQHRGHIVEVEHASQGRLPVAGPAIRYSDSPLPAVHKVPMLGEHSAEVLREWLDYDTARIDALETAGVIRTAAGGR